MVSQYVINKSRAILICVLVIGALAEAGAYSYVESLMPNSSSSESTLFQVVDISIDPSEVLVNQPVTISVGVVNLANTQGSYSVSLKINDTTAETKDVSLSANESQVVTFSVTETAEGSYNVTVGDQIGIFTVTFKPIVMPAALKVGKWSVTPHEAWVGEPIRIKFAVSNTGSDDINYRLPVKVNGVPASFVDVQLSAGATATFESNITQDNIGSYAVSVGGKSGNSFNIVPNGKHTLHVLSSKDNLFSSSFTLDGKTYGTPYHALLDVGTYTLVFPESFIRPVRGWPDTLFLFQGNIKDLTKTINMKTEVYVATTYVHTGSCPALYTWNGTSYTYVAEVSDGTGWLGYVNYFKPDGSIVFSYNYPWDYIKVDPSQLQPKDGFYSMKMLEGPDEIFYLDAAKLVVIDHPSNVNVFSTASTFIYNLAGQGTFYTVSKNPSPPLSAVNGSGTNVLPQISKMDGVFTVGTRWQWNNITLNLGNLSGAKEIKLIVAATTNWPTTGSGGANFLSYANKPGKTPSPPPYMEVKAANGSWIRVPDSRQFPLPDVTATVFVVNLTGLFPTNDYSLRINTYQDIRFDYIVVDTTSQQNLTVKSILPSSADFQQELSSNSNSSGAFTRYGDVTALVLSADDQFVIGREGDAIELKFPANLHPVAKGMERDYFVVASVWFKGNGLSYVPFAVNPLPFQAMTSFPYPSNESYPYDAAHLRYLKEYNTRIIKP